MSENRSFTSRSAVISHFVCPYKRFLTYHIEGTGLVPEKQSLDLLNGSIVHRGIQHLLEHCRKHSPDEQLTEGCIDEAVEVARELWQKELGKSGLWLHSGEEDRLEWIIAEQECLWEGLIRAFGVRRLPEILEEYEILEVEHEEVSTTFSDIVTFLGKADGLFRRKSDNVIVILSLKTCSEYVEVTTRDILHDMQGVSEWFLVQERLDRTYNEYLRLLELCDGTGDASKTFDDFAWSIGGPTGLAGYFKFCAENNQEPKVFAVQYEYLIKGKRRQEQQGSGIYCQQSFLCHPLTKESLIRIGFGVGGGTSIDPDVYKWKWGKGKYGKGWAKADIWNDIGIKAWIEMLATGQVQPEEGDPFQNILHTPDLIVRGEREIEEWLVSTRFKEEQIVEYLGEIEYEISNRSPEKIMLNNIQELIWKYFPKNTLSCHDYYGKDCQFVQHCHQYESIEDMQLAGVLIPRISHHEMEREALKQNDEKI
jgi:hypothetical protein